MKKKRLKLEHSFRLDSINPFISLTTRHRWLCVEYDSNGLLKNFRKLIQHANFATQGSIIYKTHALGKLYISSSYHKHPIDILDTEDRELELTHQW